METRICNECGVEKSVDSFSWKDKGHRWRSARCKVCVNVYVMRHYRENEGYRERRKAAARMQPPKTLENSRKDSLKYKYGITPEEYDQMRMLAFDCCSLCGAVSPGRDSPDKKWKAGHWNVDHDHKTGRVRGLLCHTCNVRVGAYEQLVESVGIDRLLAYLDGRLPTRYDVLVSGKWDYQHVRN